MLLGATLNEYWDVNAIALIKYDAYSYSSWEHLIVGHMQFVGVPFVSFSFYSFFSLF